SNNHSNQHDHRHQKEIPCTSCYSVTVDPAPPITDPTLKPTVLPFTHASFGLLRIPVTVGSSELDTVVDSGSGVTIMKASHVQNAKIIPNDHLLITTANNSPLHSIGTAVVEITIGKRQLSHPVVLVENFRY